MGKRVPVNAFKRKMLVYKKYLQTSVVATIALLTVILIAFIAVFIVDAVNLGTSPGGNTGGNKNPPAITPNVSQIESFKYENISYRDKVDVSEGVTLTWDHSGVNTSVPGTYSVKYIATDKAGNRATYTMKVIIKSDPGVMTRVQNHIKETVRSWGVTESTSKETIVKLIFNYVNNPTEKDANSARFQFDDASKTNRTDFYEEADLFITDKHGDCYSYFALSKVFFEHFGIENMDIQQTAGAWEKNPGSTHFWSLVNIGTTQSPKWYYYDSTRTKHDFIKGCLFSETQRTEFNKNAAIKGYYTYNANSYPQAATATINSGYTWK